MPNDKPPAAGAIPVPGLWDTIKGISDPGVSLTTAEKAMLGTGAATAAITIGAAPSAVEGIMDAFSKWSKINLTGISIEASNTIIDNLVASTIIPESVGINIKKALTPLGALSPIISFAGAMFLIVSFVKEMFDVSAGLMDQKMNADIRPRIPGPGEVMRAVFVDPPSIGMWREIARAAGLREEHIDLLLKSAYAPQDSGTIQSLYFRRGKDSPFAYKRLRENGLTDERIAEMIETWSVIPGVGDLITMMVKEAFNDSASALYGLDAEYPAIVESWGAKQGLDPDWIKRYWRAHWQHISPTQAFEMLHRGIIDAEGVADLLKVLDYPVYWRGKLIQLSYNPVTRVDIRRMYQDGMVTIADVEERYRKIGYDPEDARLLADWTAAEYGKTETTATATEVISAYTKGFLQRAEAVRMLVSSRWPEEKINFQLQLADQKRSAAAQDDIVETLRAAFTAHVYDEDMVRSRLLSLDIGGDMVDGFLSVWKMKRELIDEQTRRKEAISDLEEIRKVKRDSIKAALIGGEITEGKAITQLIADGFALDLAGALVAQWSGIQTVEDRLPTRSDLDRFYRAKLITETQYKSYMKRNGYPNDLSVLYFRALSGGKE